MPEILKNDDVKGFKQGSMDLMVESYSNATRTLQIRGITTEAQIIADIQTSSDRSLVTSIIDIDSTPIFLTARTSATGVQRGALYVKVSLRIDGVVVATLMAGYVADTNTPSWPNGKIESSTDGPGLIRSITGTDPAAGAEILETVPTGAKWKIIAFRFLLVTDATVTNRQTKVKFDDGTTQFCRTGATGTQVASGTISYTYANVGQEDETDANNRVEPIATDLFLLSGYRILTETTALQAGDNFGAPQLLVEEWINP